MTNVRFMPDIEIPLGDGTVTKADLYLPDDGAAHPVLLARTPYSKVLTVKELDLLNPLRAARRGYAVVIQDCRGRFTSDGDFTPFRDEGCDGAATVAWCAAQSWSDGRVGMWGMSYYGATQLLAAIEAPSALVAIAPVMTPSRYDEGWFFEGGVLRQELAQSWMAIVGAETSRRQAGRGMAAIRAVALGVDSLERDTAQPFGLDQDEIVPFYSDLIARRDDKTWWDSFAVDTRYDRITVPALHVTSWYDIFLEGAIENFVGLRERAANVAARNGQRLVIGPGAHGLLAGFLGEEDYGPAALGGIDMPSRHFRFFDRHFGIGRQNDSIDHGDDRPVSLFLLGTNEWRTFPAWPPLADVLSFFLEGEQPNSIRGDGKLSRSVPASGFEHRFLHDPSRPVATRGGAVLGGPGGFRPGPYDQRPVEARDDVLVYTSEPLDRDLTVIGMVRAEIEATSTASSFDLCLKLVDVDSFGRAVNIADGAQRSEQLTGRCAIEVRIGSVGVVFRAGHRVRIEIAGSNFPRLERNLDGPAVQTIFTGVSRILLPVSA
jgi:hypothetical protein